jgi:hypothetical protein
VGLRNCDLPNRRPDGSLTTTPRIALDLNYLLTFYGNDAELEPQRLLGLVAALLNAQPALSSADIAAALANAQPFNAPPFTAAPFTTPPFQPDLGQQIEQVKLTLLPLSLEELSKLWSVFYQIPFALTMAFQASVVLIEPLNMAPRPALPVTRRIVAALPSAGLTIASVQAAGGANQPITAGSTIVIQGAGPLASVSAVQIVGYGADLTPAAVASGQISVVIPADVPAGARSLQAVQTAALGSPPTNRTAAVSNPLAFTLQPVIAITAGSASQITLSVQPTVRAGQRVTLLLNEATSPPPVAPASYTFQAPPPPADTGSLVFALSGVTKGLSYFVRIQVDGAESPLTLDPTSPQFGPTATLS